uniref:Uncharacterized protein n=1 Tax=viral metagenome TaxID=1070528 RepID=A0A6M3IRB2_9ZZZZ
MREAVQQFGKGEGEDEAIADVVGFGLLSEVQQVFDKLEVWRICDGSDEGGERSEADASAEMVA